MKPVHIPRENIAKIAAALPAVVEAVNRRQYACAGCGRLFNHKEDCTRVILSKLRQR